MNQIEELVRQGVSQAKIAELTGFDRKTVRKYFKQADSVPHYGPRELRPSKLDRRTPPSRRLERRRVAADHGSTDQPINGKNTRKRTKL